MSSIIREPTAPTVVVSKQKATVRKPSKLEEITTQKCRQIPVRQQYHMAQACAPDNRLTNNNGKKITRLNSSKRFKPLLLRIDMGAISAAEQIVNLNTELPHCCESARSIFYRDQFLKTVSVRQRGMSKLCTYALAAVLQPQQLANLREFRHNV